MALFSRSKKASADTTTAIAATQAKIIDRDLTSVIVAPVITEKAMMGHDRHVYTFFVRKDATKHLVHDAVKTLYGVTPVSVNIVNKLPRASMSRARGRITKESGYKKAYVYLKDGDTISVA